MEGQTEEKLLAKEEKKRKRAELDSRLAKLAADEAKLAAERAKILAEAVAADTGSLDSDAAPSLAKSPVRKRKSDVLAEASPVKQKGTQRHSHI